MKVNLFKMKRENIYLLLEVNDLGNSVLNELPLSDHELLSVLS